MQLDIIGCIKTSGLTHEEKSSEHGAVITVSLKHNSETDTVLVY
jgi:hypothetical protein